MWSGGNTDGGPIKEGIRWEGWDDGVGVDECGPATAEINTPTVEWGRCDTSCRWLGMIAIQRDQFLRG